jgi:uncharacterized protein YndB with AHSA1/START domain
MPDQKPGGDPHKQDATTLVVRKTIRATPERLFAAWTEPEQLKQWWGPPSVNCVDAQVDLRVGGRYRIANQLPDGKVLWITGEFKLIEPPRKLVYSWSIEPGSSAAELVTVLFEPHPAGGTEVIILHERIPNKTARDTHELGWQGCLDGLAAYLR